MTIHKKGQAHWEGDIKRGKGTVSTESGVLNQQPYGFNTRGASSWFPRLLNEYGRRQRCTKYKYRIDRCQPTVGRLTV